MMATSSSRRSPWRRASWSRSFALVITALREGAAPVTVIPRPLRNSTSPSSLSWRSAREDGVGVDAQDRRQVPGRREPLARPGLAVGQRPADLGRHLLVERLGVVRVDRVHGAKYASTMVLEVPAAPESATATDDGPEAPAPEALIEEARRTRRRRYRRWAGTAALVAAVLLALVRIPFALGDIGGGGGSPGPSRPVQPHAAPVTPPAQTAPAGVSVVGRGPTAVDFTDATHGWIASASVALPLGNPTIVRTSDGGQTWQPTPVPNLAAQSVDPATRSALGGLVGLHFANGVRGWFFQAGIGWQTNDRGVRWTTMRFPLDGALVALTSAGADVWALLDTCPIGAVSCPQDLAKGFIYHATSATSLTWHRVGGPLPAGVGALYPAPGHGVVVALGPATYHRSVGRVASVAPSSGCVPIGPLTGGALAGVCGGGGGGDASASRISVSTDQGTTWRPLLGGPPSSQYMGLLTTNGTDTVFYVTGGQTLWQTSTSAPGWRAVLQVAQGSTDEIEPVFVDGAHGLALVSNGLDAHWFETHDGGITWEPVTLP